MVVTFCDEFHEMLRRGGAVASELAPHGPKDAE
jgi:hypothetical protein